MMKTKHTLFGALLAVALLGVGCASVDVAPTDAPDIFLERSCERKSMGTTIAFPRGKYIADFASKQGIYYKAERMVIYKALGISRPYRGGLFVPHPSAENKKQAAWFDWQSASGGLLLQGISSNTRLYRFSEKVPYKELE